MKKIIVIFLCAAAFSCQKEIIDISSDFNNSYLKFESFDEVNKLLGPQSTSDIKQYAENQNVESFYKKSHEIYKQLRDAKYENPDDIFKAFEKY
jgi:hypothetical protein